MSKFTKAPPATLNAPQAPIRHDLPKPEGMTPIEYLYSFKASNLFNSRVEAFAVLLTEFFTEVPTVYNEHDLMNYYSNTAGELSKLIDLHQDSPGYVTGLQGSLEALDALVKVYLQPYITRQQVAEELRLVIDIDDNDGSDGQ